MAGGAAGSPVTAMSLTNLVKYRGKAVDLLVLACPVLLLVAVYTLPMETRRALAFQTTSPTLRTAYTSHFVHFSFGHLLTNLIGYVLLAPLAYLLSVGAGRRRQFYVVFTSLLLGFPFALSLINLLLLGPATAIGFSGIVLGFFGYLPIALYQFVGRHAEGRAPTRYIPLVFFIGVASIATVLFWAAFISIGVLIAAVVVMAGYLSQFLDHEYITGLGRFDSGGFGELALAATVLLLAYPITAFPSTALVGTRVINLIAHLFGYALSFISTFITIITAKASDTLRSFGLKSDE